MVLFYFFDFLLLFEKTCFLKKKGIQGILISFVIFCIPFAGVEIPYGSRRFRSKACRKFQLSVSKVPTFRVRSSNFFICGVSEVPTFRVRSSNFFICGVSEVPTFSLGLCKCRNPLRWLVSETKNSSTAFRKHHHFALQKERGRKTCSKGILRHILFPV